jgi:hypothetical protein
MFGTMLNLVTTPSTLTMSGRHIPTYPTPDADNHIDDFVAPPTDMLLA